MNSPMAAGVAIGLAISYLGLSVLIFTANRACLCGHERQAHEHYHSGTYCGHVGCPCVGYRRPWFSRR